MQSNAFTGQIYMDFFPFFFNLFVLFGLVLFMGVYFLMAV